MPKAKSSASKATLKKHARKAAAKEEKDREQHEAEQLEELEGEEQEPGQETQASTSFVKAEAPTPSKQTVRPASTVAATPASSSVPKNAGKPKENGKDSNRKVKKQSKKHKKGEAPPPPRKKQYIPPPKPPRGNVDPVDIFGLGVTGTGYERVPAERIVTLRLLNKKDASSIERALDELNAWASSLSEDSDPEELQYIAEIVPVWVHHFSRLSSHVSRKVRLTTASFNAFLLHRGPSKLLELTVPSLVAPVNLEQDDFLASQLCSTFDADRQVRAIAGSNWKALQQHFELPVYLSEIISSLNSVILDEGNFAKSNLKTRNLTDEARLALLEEQDRRIGQLTASLDAFTDLLSAIPEEKSELLQPVLDSDDFWNCLSSKHLDSASVRRAAWRCLGASLGRSPSADIITQNNHTISHLALEGALEERDPGVHSAMWEPFILFLRKYPSVWKFKDGDDDESSSEEEFGDSKAQLLLPWPFQHLLTFLQLGCNGNAIGNYPAIPLVVHTIPDTVWKASSSRVELLFTSFWAAYTGKALDANGLQAFTTCLVDLVLIFGRRENSAPVSSLAGQQILTLWDYGVGVVPPPGKSMTFEGVASSAEITRAIEFMDENREGWLQEHWSHLSNSYHAGLQQATLPPARLSALVTCPVKSKNDRLQDKTSQLLKESAVGVLNDKSRKDLDELVCAWTAARPDLLEDEAVLQALECACEGQYRSRASLVQLYIRSQESQDSRQKIWTRIVHECLQDPDSEGLGNLLPAVKLADSDPSLFESLHESELDDALLGLLDKELHDQARLSLDSQTVLRRVLRQPKPLASNNLASALITHCAGALVQLVKTTVTHGLTDTNDIPLSILDALECADPAQLASAGGTSTFEPLFEAAMLCRESLPDLSNRSQKLVALGLQCFSTAERSQFAFETAKHLSIYLLDKHCVISPLVLTDAISTLLTVSTGNDLWQHFLPSESKVKELAGDAWQVTSSDWGDLLFLPSELQSDVQPASLPLLHRCLEAWVSAMSIDHTLAQNLWLAQYLTLFEKTNSGGLTAEQTASATLFARARTYLLAQASSKIGPEWHDDATRALQNGAEFDNPLFRLIRDLIQRCSESPAQSTLAQVLSTILQYSDAGEREGELWLRVAQKFQASNFKGSIGILKAIVGLLFDNQRFKRLQGETASSLSAIRPADLGRKSTESLQLLMSIAPPVSSDHEFIPLNRAMFLVQAIQKWFVAEDSDIDEDTSFLCMLLFANLTHLLQGTSGSHWDTFFDLAESNIESAAWNDASSLPAVAASCQFLRNVQDCAASNSDFRKLTAKPFQRCMRLLCESLARHEEHKSTNLPDGLLSQIFALLSSASHIDGDLTKMTSLMGRISIANQARLYQIVCHIVKSFTDASVLRLETSGSQEDRQSLLPKLPQELMNMTSRSASGQSTPDLISQTLFAWLLIFYHFIDATVAIRNSYIEQIRKSGALTDGLLPLVYSLNGVSNRGRWPDLSPWSVEDFDFDALAIDEEHFVPSRLAAHVYFRALQTVPSLVRSAWEGYRDRQFSQAVSSFTSQYFSPLLIEAEMREVAHAQQTDVLKDENLAIKVLTSVNEVKATYTVDEQPMELSVRVPADFPLALVEVKEGKRVGVPDSTWRAWMLNVQLVINAQNGSIADALAFFKNNASRHFEGVEACAICYSVIATTDRSLPTKRCRTCKNLFHPSCLYKWFSTSHGSSCPLCRSLF